MYTNYIIVFYSCVILLRLNKKLGILVKKYIIPKVSIIQIKAPYCLQLLGLKTTFAKLKTNYQCIITSGNRIRTVLYEYLCFLNFSDFKH